MCALAAYLHSLQPEGCVAQECESRAMRSATGLVATLSLLSLVLIVIGLSGLVAKARRSAHSSNLARAALLAAAGGLVLLVLGAFIQELMFAGDWSLTPFFVIPGALALVAGFILCGIYIANSGALPKPLGLLMAVSAGALLLANEQKGTVLLLVPFGLVVAATGVFMWMGQSPGTAQQASAAGAG